MLAEGRRREDQLKAWGAEGTGPGQFALPHSIVIDSNRRLYVADRNNARIQVFDTEGKLLAVWDKPLESVKSTGHSFPKGDRIAASGYEVAIRAADEVELVPDPAIRIAAIGGTGW